MIVVENSDFSLTQVLADAIRAQKVVDVPQPREKYDAERQLPHEQQLSNEDQDNKDLGRKRERPKKFDDFVLSAKPVPPLKKDKKAKGRKFFFPEDFDKDDDEGEVIAFANIGPSGPFLGFFQKSRHYHHPLDEQKLNGRESWISLPFVFPL